MCMHSLTRSVGNSLFCCVLCVVCYAGSICVWLVMLMCAASIGGSCLAWLPMCVSY